VAVPAPPGAPGAGPSSSAGLLVPPAPVAASPAFPGGGPSFPSSRTTAPAASPVATSPPGILAPPAPVGSSPAISAGPAPFASSPTTLAAAEPLASSPTIPAAAAPFASSSTIATAPLSDVPSPIPRSGTLETLTPEQTQALGRFVEAMESQDYFQLLGLPYTATKGDIKKAFYRDSRTYHPDRVFHLTDEVSKQHIHSIYKRITEAYYVLRDDAKRAKYLVDIQGRDRAAKLRFTEASEAEQKAEAKKVVEEEFGTVPKARPFFRSALQDIERQNWASAERNLKMGLTYEPGATRFKEKLAEVQKKLDEQRRASGDAFKIR
jgi:hypothetical protein